MNKYGNRRQFLRIMALGSGSALLAACSQSPTPSVAPTAAPAKPTTAPAAPAQQAPAVPAAGSATSAPAAAAFSVDALYDAAKKEGKVVWWDQHEARVAQKFIDGFKAKYPGVDVEYFEASLDELRPRAVAEARADRISLDVIDTGQNFIPYKEAGLTSDNTDVIEAAGIPRAEIYEGTYSPEWTVYIASYNPNLVKAEEAPTSWDALLDPKWKGKLALETRLRPFVYGTPFMGGEDKVAEYLGKLKEQNPRFTKGNTDTDTLLVAGEFSIAIGTYLHNYQKFKARNQPWDFAPIAEVYSNVPGPGYTVPSKAPHKNAGRLFLHWFVGPEGVKIMDAERFKGNPQPGTGTGQSKLLQEKNMTVKLSPIEYELNYSKYESRYLGALGLPTR
ncbi:MAG: ABC transporter substrate-binding protein [Chloroflexota bacterium]